jgi:hypothetical protein
LLLLQAASITIKLDAAKNFKIFTSLKLNIVDSPIK